MSIKWLAITSITHGDKTSLGMQLGEAWNRAQN